LRKIGEDAEEVKEPAVAVLPFSASLPVAAASSSSPITEEEEEEGAAPLPPCAPSSGAPPRSVNSCRVDSVGPRGAAGRPPTRPSPYPNPYPREKALLLSSPRVGEAFCDERSFAASPPLLRLCRPLLLGAAQEPSLSPSAPAPTRAKEGSREEILRGLLLAPPASTVREGPGEPDAIPEGKPPSKR
jgi:hypothetical protein